MLMISERSKKSAGQTKMAGFQIGARRTMPVGFEKAWQLLTSEKGLSLWLGKTGELELKKGAQYRLEDGTHGEVKVCEPLSHLRLTWHQSGWQRASTIQVRVIPRDERTVIAFHQEHLPGLLEREERRTFFLGVLDKLAGMI
jgi:uncharacterized protein YndB with AHSA1/START domain